MAQEVNALIALHGADMQPLLEAAGAVRDAGHRIITFSPKVQSPAWQTLKCCLTALATEVLHEKTVAYDNQAAGQLITARLFAGVPATDAAVPGHLRLLHLCTTAGAGSARVHDAARGAGRGAPGRRAGVHRSAVHAGCASVPPYAHLVLQLLPRSVSSVLVQLILCSTVVLCLLR